MTSLSVLVPAYNEQYLVATSLARLAALELVPLLDRIQVIVVDDRSTDATPARLRAFATERGLSWLDDAPPRDGVAACARGRSGKTDWLFLRHERNTGKGRAVRTALARADGDITVVHDADLEYHPRDLARIVRVFVEHDADAVFGSRFAGSEVRRALFFNHELGNRLLTFLTNLVTNVNLTDMETCYKAVRTDLLRSMPLVSDDFRIEPELTIKLAKRGARLFEVPIDYAGRTYQEGKKINWRDGLSALGAIVRFGASDNIFAEDEHGAQICSQMSRAPRFSAWLGDAIRPHCGQRVLELGSHMGHLLLHLVPRELYVATDVHPLYLKALQSLTVDRPYLRVARTDVTQPETLPRVPGGFDTVVCVNTLENVDDDLAALRSIRATLADGGRAILVVPQGPDLMGTLDQALSHRRRYTPESLRQLGVRAGFQVREILPFNRCGWPAWWVNGSVLRRRRFTSGQVLALNTLVPLCRRIDAHLPLPSLSLIAVCEM